MHICVNVRFKYKSNIHVSDKDKSNIHVPALLKHVCCSMPLGRIKVYFINVASQKCMKREKNTVLCEKINKFTQAVTGA